MSLLLDLMPNLIPEVIPVEYDEIKQVLPHDVSIENFYDDAEKVMQQMLSSCVASEQPIILHTAGTVGSGKSRCCKTLLSLCPKYQQYLFLQFDAVMEALPQYQKDQADYCQQLGLHDGLVKTFQRWELPARIIGYHLLEKAIDNRLNILFEHSASFKSHVDLLKNIKEKYGYQTKMIYLNPPDEIVLERLSRREVKHHRYTPHSYMQDRKEKINQLIPIYKKIVDVFVEYNGEDNDYSNFNC